MMQVQRHTNSETAPSEQRNSQPAPRGGAHAALQTEHPEEAASALRSLYPVAQTEVTRDFCYIARRSIDSRDSIYASALLGALDSPLTAGGRAVCVLDFSVPDQELLDVGACNIVRDETDPYLREGKFYHDLVAGALPQSQILSLEERDRHLFAPAAELLRSGRLLSLDHHYPFKTLATSCATVLTVDFIDYLHRAGEGIMLRRLENAFTVMDHCDADMLLSQFARRSASDREFLAAHGELIKDAALMNDFGELRGDGTHANSVRLLYWLMRGMEAKINDGEYTVQEGLDRVRSAIEFAAKYGTIMACDVLFRQLTNAGVQDEPAGERKHMRNLMRGMSGFNKECDRLESLAAAYSPACSEVRPGSFTKFGSLLFAYIPDRWPEQENFSVLLFLRLRHPEMLEGVDVVASSSPIGEGSEPTRPRMFRLRSLMQADGRYVDLCRVCEHLPGAGGRSFAIGLSKGGIHGLDVVQAANDAARAVAAVKRGESSE